MRFVVVFNTKSLFCSRSPARRMGSMRRKRSGTTAPRRSWRSSWSAWIRSTGRWTSMPPWRRWRRKCKLTWTSQRTSPTRPVETIKPTSLLSTVRVWHCFRFLEQRYIWVLWCNPVAVLVRRTRVHVSSVWRWHGGGKSLTIRGCVTQAGVCVCLCPAGLHSETANASDNIVPPLRQQCSAMMTVDSEMLGAAFSSCFTLSETTSNCFPPFHLPPRRRSG